MTVQLRYNRSVTGVEPVDAATFLEALAGLDGETSDTGGTYSVVFTRYEFRHGDTEPDLHFHVELTDADDDQFPQCKDDFAQRLTDLTPVDLGTAATIENDIEGQLI